MKKEIINGIAVIIVVAIIVVAIVGTVFFMLQQKTKTIEGEVIDVKILHDGIITYWEIYFKDESMIKARPSGYGGNTYDFVKNSRVLIHFTRSKYMPQNYWTIDSVIKLPDIVEEG